MIQLHNKEIRTLKMSENKLREQNLTMKTNYNSEPTEKIKSKMTFIMYGTRLYSRQFGKFRSNNSNDYYETNRILLLDKYDKVKSHTPRSDKNPFYRLYYNSLKPRPMTAREMLRSA